MHPCPPRAEGRVFSGHRGGRGASSEALRRSSADSDDPVGGAILLHHDSRRDRGDGGPVCAALSELSEALVNLGREGEERERPGVQPGTPSITSDLNIIHDARFTLSVPSAIRMNRYPVRTDFFCIASDSYHK